MTTEAHLILNIAVAVSVALVGGLVAHRLRQSAVVGYLLAGVAIGPFTPGFIGDRGQIAALAEIGVIFLMFALGLEFSLKDLGAVRGVAIVGTAIQVGLTAVAGYFLSQAIGWTATQGIFFGGIIAISSTMVILKLLIDRGEVGSHHGRVLLGMLIIQDLAAVLLIVVLPKIAVGDGASLTTGLVTLATAVSFIAAILVLGTRVVPRLMARVEHLASPELFLLTAVALALGSATASTLLGLSPALGAFLAGLLLTETEFDHRIVAEVVPMRNLFGTLFFVSVGMLIDPWFIVANATLVIGLALFIILVKGIATLVAVVPFGIGARASIFTAFGLVQIGEFSYLLAQVGREVGAVSDAVYSLVLTSSLVTIVLTPAAFGLAERVHRAFTRLPAYHGWLGREAARLASGAPTAEHAVVIGYGRVGRRVADGLLLAHLPVTVIEDDFHLVRQIADRGLAVILGDATNPRIVSAAHVEAARLVVVALPDAGATHAVVANVRRANPRAAILARVAREEFEQSIRGAGATAIVAPERAGALLLLEESARALGIDTASLTADLFENETQATSNLPGTHARGSTTPDGSSWPT